MFEGFDSSMIDTGEAVIRVRHGGEGPPLLLLHGHPQTHADHEPYSKRAMARDQVAVMRHLGFERFFVAGHDRGARCAYRMALDHPKRVRRLAVLDIVPTVEVFRRMDMRLGLAFWHWFFLAQPSDLPERLIGANPDNYYFHQPGGFFAPEALAEYRRCVRNPATIHASSTSLTSRPTTTRRSTTSTTFTSSLAASSPPATAPPGPTPSTGGAAGRRGAAPPPDR
jgi:haloacetate dehalogenase